MAILAMGLSFNPCPLSRPINIWWDLFPSEEDHCFNPCPLSRPINRSGGFRALRFVHLRRFNPCPLSRPINMLNEDTMSFDTSNRSFNPCPLSRPINCTRVALRCSLVISFQSVPAEQADQRLSGLCQAGRVSWFQSVPAEQADQP